MQTARYRTKQLSAIPAPGITGRPARLAVEQKTAGVLNHVLDPLEEGDGLAAIDQPVVIGECDVHDGPRDNVLTHHHCPLIDRVHAQDGRLRQRNII